MNFDAHEEFLILLARVMARQATAEDGKRLAVLLRQNPAWVRDYRATVEADCLLAARFRAAHPLLAFLRHPAGKPSRRAVLARAAALALLLAGLGWAGAAYSRSRMSQTSLTAAADWASMKVFVSEPAQPPAMVAAPVLASNAGPAAVAAPEPAAANISIASAAVAASQTTPTPAAVSQMKGENGTVMSNPTVNRTLLATALAASVAAGPASATASPTGEILSEGLCCVSGETRYWETCFTNAIPICWAWAPTNAVRAVLAYAGMNASGTQPDYTRAAGDAVFTLPALTTDEDLYTLTLAYFDSNGDLISTSTGRVAMVFGTATQTNEVVLPTYDTSSMSATLAAPEAWPRILRPNAKIDNAVLAYETSWCTNTAEFTSLTLATRDGKKTSTKELAPPGGWYALKMEKSNWGYGWFALTLAADYDSLSGSFYRGAHGFILRFE